MRISRENRVYQMSGKNPAVATVKPGEQVVVETHDCFTGAIAKEEHLFSSVGWENINPATGPIAVEGAEVGDVLEVAIEEIDVAEQGVMTTAPGMGIIGDEVKEETTTIIPIEEGQAVFSDKLRLPIRPMIGVIGTAPVEGEVPCGTPGPHGGNMDCKEIVAGTRVYLPVNHPGALLALGDLHALMADGEVSVTGLEIPGEVTLRTRVLKGRRDALPLPMVSNEEKLMIIHSEETLDEAVKKGVSRTVKFLREACSLDLDTALRLLSLVGEVGICQVVDPLMTIRIGLPWSVLNALGFSAEDL